MTQLRRVVDPALQALFDTSQQLAVANLYTITLSGGAVLRYTDHDQVVTVDGTSWLLGPGLESNNLKMSIGVEVDTMQLGIYGQADTLMNGKPVMPFINFGGLDGAKVQSWRCFSAMPGDAWVGRIHRFTGYVSDIDRPSKVRADVTVRNIFERLNVKIPANVYQPGCLAHVYDAQCGVNRAAFTTSATVTTGTTGLRLQITASGLTQAAGYFSLGAVRFTSGGNAGVLRTVRLHEAGGVITFMQPLPVPVMAGDSIQIYPGCDQTKPTCVNKFSNGQRFRGQRFIPSASTVL